VRRVAKRKTLFIIETKSQGWPSGSPRARGRMKQPTMVCCARVIDSVMNFPPRGNFLQGRPVRWAALLFSAQLKVSAALRESPGPRTYPRRSRRRGGPASPQRPDGRCWRSQSSTSPQARHRMSIHPLDGISPGVIRLAAAIALAAEFGCPFSPPAPDHASAAQDVPLCSLRRAGCRPLELLSIEADFRPMTQPPSACTGVGVT
jgi:hypothetical protein